MSRKAMSTMVVLGAIGLVTATAVAQPMMEITKNCPGLRYLGRSATFEIAVANNGNAPAYDVVVTDVVPPGIDFVSADNNGKREGSNIVWRLGTVEPGQSYVLKPSFRCNTIGVFTNAANLTYCAKASSSCELEVKGIAAILLECVDDPDPIELNGTLTYTITVTNQGTAVGTNIVIDCTLPAQEEFVSGDGPTAVSADGKSVTFAPLPTLAPKARAVYRLTVKGVGVGDVRFAVSMTSDQLTSPVAETESTHIYE